MKKFRQFAVATLMVLAMCSLIAVFAACDKISEIKVADGGLPKTTFILGQELDLSGGKLTVVNNGKEEEVALDSSDVTVTGFDKDKAGEQEITISYKDFSTTVKINVVPRMVVSGYASKYFIGEQFSKTSGSVRVNLDDGKYINKPLSDDEISVQGFDSSKAGETVVTLNYKSGDKDYSTTVPVQILEVATKTLTPPNNRFYKSHQTEIDLAGAGITLKSAGTGSDVLTRRISVTADMLSDYDLGVVTIANIDEPLTLPITVNYGGQKIGSFDIRVSYSAVSLMHDKAEELKALDFTSGIPAITEEQGEAAMFAMKHYFTLDVDEKGLVPVEEKALIARIASVYGRALWDAEIDAFSRTFKVEFYDLEGIKYQELEMKSTNIAASIQDYAKLEDPDAAVREYSKLLENIKSEFSSLVLTGEEKLENYLSEVYEATYFDKVLTNLDFMYGLFEVLPVSKLPVDWTEDNIVNYKDVIYESINYFLHEKLYGRDLYDCVSAWRGDAEGKYIPEMYLTYCWKADDRDGINNVAIVYVPQPFTTLLVSLEAASSELSGLGKLDIVGGSMSLDTSLFMWYYNHIRASMEEIKHESEMMAWMLENLEPYVDFNFEATVDSQLRDGRDYNGKGYNYYQGMMLGDSLHTQMWENYIGVLDDALINDEYDMDKIEKMLMFLLDMPDSNKYAFISSVYTTYQMYILPSYALDYNSGLDTLSRFSTLLGVYGKGITDSEDGTVLVQAAVPEAVNELLLSLLKAIEDCSRRFVSSANYTSSFLSNMAQTVKLYNDLDKAAAAGDAKAKAGKDWFDAKYGKYYQQYLDISKLYDENGNFTGVYDNVGEEWEAKFEQVRQTAYDIIVKDYLIKSGKSDDYVVLLAQYELLEKISLEILSSGNPAVIDAYYNKIFDFEDFGVSTLEFAVLSAREAYRYYLVGLGIWDQYKASGLKEFMILAAPVMNMGYEMRDAEGNLIEVVYTEEDAAAVEAVLAAYRNLSVMDQMLFILLNTSETADYYYGAMLYYFGETLLTDGVENKKCTDFIKSVFLFEKATSLYLYAQEYEGMSDAVIQALDKMYNEANSAYNALSEADKALLPEYIHEMYTFYCEKYSELTQNN